MVKSRYIAGLVCGTALAINHFPEKQLFTEEIQTASAKTANYCDTIKPLLESELKIWNPALLASIKYVEIGKEPQGANSGLGLLGLLGGAAVQQTDTPDKHGQLKNEGGQYTLTIYGIDNAPVYLRHFLAHAAWNQLGAQKTSITSAIQANEDGFLARATNEVATQYLNPKYAEDATVLNNLVIVSSAGSFTGVLPNEKILPFITFSKGFWGDGNIITTVKFAAYSSDYLGKYREVTSSLKAQYKVVGTKGCKDDKCKQKADKTLHPLVAQALQLDINDRRIASDREIYLTELFIRLLSSYLDRTIDPKGRGIIEAIKLDEKPIIDSEQKLARLPEIRCKS